MEVESGGEGSGGLLAEAADPFESIFAKRGEKQHKSGKKKVVSTGTVRCQRSKLLTPSTC